MPAHVGLFHYRNIVAISDIPPERLKQITQFTDQVIVPKAGQEVFAVSAEVKSTPGLEDALYWARGAVIEAACNLTMQQLYEVAKLRYPGQSAVQAVERLVGDFQRFIDISGKLIEQRCVVLRQIVERRRAIAVRTASAENEYQRLVKSGLNENLARIRAPEFNAAPMLAAITKMEQEVSGIERFLGVGNFDRLPDVFKVENGG